MRLLFVALIGAVSGSYDVLARNPSRAHSAVVCTSEANGPWVLKARGTLTRTQAKTELLYEFRSADHVFGWRFVTSREGNTTVLGPGLLLDRFLTPPQQPHSSDVDLRRQTLEDARTRAGHRSLRNRALTPVLVLC
jgi:hypothetical protein